MTCSCSRFAQCCPRVVSIPNLSSTSKHTCADARLESLPPLWDPIGIHLQGCNSCLGATARKSKKIPQRERLHVKIDKFNLLASAEKLKLSISNFSGKFCTFSWTIASTSPLASSFALSTQARGSAEQANKPYN